MRLQIVFHIGEQSGRFIARGLDHPTIELSQRRCHPFVPAHLVAGLSRLFQNNEVAVGVHGDEAQAAGKRFVLGHAEVFWGSPSKVLSFLVTLSLPEGDGASFKERQRWRFHWGKCSSRLLSKDRSV